MCQFLNKSNRAGVRVGRQMGLGFEKGKIKLTKLKTFRNKIERQHLLERDSQQVRKMRGLTYP